MSALRILLIEPDPAISAGLVMALRTRLYDVYTTQAGAAAIPLLSGLHFDLAIVDRSLSDIDGCDLCRQIRAYHDQIPLLMLGPGKDAVLDAFRAGIDDYLPLPVDHREFLARVRAMIRRSLPMTPSTNLIRAGDIVVDLDSKLVNKSGRSVAVTASEFLLLEYMIRNKNRVVTKEELASDAWGKGRRISRGRLPMHMNNLRNKLKDSIHSQPIYTVSGKGYLLVEHETAHRSILNEQL